MITYSNPRMIAEIENWPSGTKRVTATFWIEIGKRGERAVRVTNGAPKKLTFAKQMRIVDGDDGKTYIAALTYWDHITIYRGDMKFSQETVFERDARYPGVRELFQ